MTVSPLERGPASAKHPVGKLPGWADQAVGGRALASGSRDQWLAAYHKGKGAIDAWEASVIAGDHPRFTPWHVWSARIRGLDLRDPVAHRAKLWWRAAGLDLYSQTPGIRAVPTPHLLLTHPRYPWAVASPHGLVRDGEAVGAALVHVAAVRGQWGDDELAPDEGLPDGLRVEALTAARWVLAVAGVAFVDHLCLVPDAHGLPVLTVHRTQAADDDLAETVRAWRWEHLQCWREPERGRPAGPPAGRGIRGATAEEESIVARIIALREQAARAAQNAIVQEESLTGLLRASTSDTTAIVLDDGRRALVARDHGPLLSFDERRLKELAPIAAHLCIQRGAPKTHVRIYPRGL